jgi:hypothetical protein
MRSKRTAYASIHAPAFAWLFLSCLLGACTELAAQVTPDGGSADSGVASDDSAVPDDGAKPEDIDAGCLVACGPNERCVEGGGSFACRCETGYSMDGGTCLPSEACPDMPCGSNQDCVEVESGSRVCSCRPSSDCSSGPGTYCQGSASYRCSVDAQGCLIASAPIACPSGGPCESATCEPDMGCAVAAKPVGEACGAGVCSDIGECVDCLDNDDCGAEICVDGECVEPRCGDGIVTSPEECDPGASGSVNDTWRCGPDCESRTAYITCPDSPDQCDANASCQTGTSGRAQCAPLSGNDLGGAARDPAEVCPALDGGYVQKLFSNVYCVIECGEPSDCPVQLRSCIDNPFAGTSAHEAYRYCVPP